MARPSSTTEPSYWRRLWQGLRRKKPPAQPAAQHAAAGPCTSVAATRYADRRRSSESDASASTNSNMAARRVGGTLVLAHALGPVPDDDTDPARAAAPTCLRSPQGRQALEQGILRLALRVGQARIAPSQWRLILAALPEAEAARIRRFYHDKDRRLALGSVLLQRAAACWVLGDGFTALQVKRSAHNKPYVKTNGRRLPGWGFNVSHHGEWAVLASERDAAVGTDLVDLRDRPLEPGVTSLDYLAHFRRHLTPAEWDALVALPEEGARYRAFYRLWAVKEAYVKALGLGLSFPIRRIECPVVDVDRLLSTGGTCCGGEDEIMMDGYALGDWQLEFARLEPGGHYLWCTATGPPQPPPRGSDGDEPLPPEVEPITPGLTRPEEAALRARWHELTLEECLPRQLRAEWERLGKEDEAACVPGE